MLAEIETTVLHAQRERATYLIRPKIQQFLGADRVEPQRSNGRDNQVSGSVGRVERPGRVAEVIDLPFGRDRGPRLRRDERFLDLRDDLADLLLTASGVDRAILVR